MKIGEFDLNLKDCSRESSWQYTCISSGCGLAKYDCFSASEVTPKDIGYHTGLGTSPK